MQGFEVFWRLWFVLMVVVGAAMVLYLVLGFYLTSRRSPSDDDEEVEQYPQEIQARRGRIPAVLWALYLGMAAFMIAYFAWVAASRANF